MSKLSRKIQRNKDRLITELRVKMSKPDDECNNCQIPLKKDCFMNCPMLYKRNRERNKDLVEKVIALTGDHNI